MKNSSGSSPPVTVTLVKRGSVLYPKSDLDYKVLLGCKVPVYRITEDFVPTLVALGNKNNVTFTTLDFAELELKMFEKVQERWPFEAALTKTGLVFKAPKKLKRERFEKMLFAIRQWYSKHWIIVEFTEKKTAKSLKLYLSKRDTYADV